MSDSFADLWSTTAPLPPKTKPQTLSGASGTQNLASKPSGGSKPDIFALLASAGPTTSPTPRYGSGLTASAPSSRAMTPSRLALSSSSRATPQPSGQAYSQPVSKVNSGDAFGDLFASSAGKEANMTLAARLALEGKGRGRDSPMGASGTTNSASTAAAADGGAWAGLDALIGGGLNASNPPPVAPHVKVDDVDDWGLGDFGKAPANTNQSGMTNGNHHDDDILGALAAPPPRSSRTPSLRQGSSPPAEALAQIVQMGFSTAQARSALAATEGGTNVPAALESLLSGSSPKPAPRPRTTTAKSLWDLEAFADPSPAHETRRNDGMARAQSDSSTRVRAGHKEKVASVDEDFDFGGREDRVDGEREWRSRPAQGRNRGLLDLSDDEEGGDELPGGGHSREHEDDILGALGAPPAEPRRPRARPTTDARAARAPSPPPHILGQIVEMGFSVNQARAALAQTPGGLDVAAALESLLAGSSTSAPAPSAPPPPRPRGAPKGQKERERERLERMERQQSGSTPSVTELQEQADKLLSQASEIGLSVFSKASAFWDKGKERVVKAYEERAGAAADDGASGRRGKGRGVIDGRPKWMQDAMGADQEERHNAGGFKDDRGGFADDEEHEVIRDEKIRMRDEEWGVKENPPPLLHHEEEVDLFAPEPVVSVRAAHLATTSAVAGSTQRRPIPTRGASSVSSSSSRAIPVPAPTSVPDRMLPTASSASLTTALRHKTAGTDAFKLGQYAVAADAYTAALEALPEDHLLRVPLYTNRALARMKSGDYRNGEEDCAAALVLLIGNEIKDIPDAPPPTWDPTMLPTSLARADANGAWAHPAGHGVDLADGYAKALRRRAECREARERWAGATADWEALAGCAWAGAGVRSEASRGRTRCRGMIGGGGGGSGTQTQAKPAAKPRPTPRAAAPKTVTPAGPSKAVAALQAANAAADADDAARAALKDTVDARVLAWRGGKEGNIRALLCSLDAVLWDAVLEGARVKGLHEVVSAAQVKRAYVKAVGRVHPDKLNASNATVEQRMLANAVFGALNEAWIAFQAGQK